jgi:hypothetical protein
MARATFLLPAAERFGAQRLSSSCATALGRADRMPAGDAGRRVQLLRHFGIPEGTWPIAALSRQADVGDAAGAAWLRADPAYLRADINGVRLLAHGDALALTDADRDALLPALKPLFGDAGFALDAPTPSRWYLRLAREATLPAFADPGDALGDDIFEHLDSSFEARRWRALSSEAQVVLHNHPWNEARAAQGKPPVNALWFWGGGMLPDARIDTHSWHAITYTDDPTAQALAAIACGVESLPPRYPGGSGDLLFDLAATRDLAWLEREWLQPALDALHRGEINMFELDAEDGRVFGIGRWQRLRFWRKPLTRFDG